ncbi:MAG TPA: sigma-70 family RNA polymerase sigma factor [Pseudobdellovibrionaceae bacterium]|jgi:RNA polymerase sigma-70 factor (ECF subfamily)
MINKSDQELLLSLAQGNNKALDYLFKRHSNKVYNYALKRKFNTEQAQDLVQIVFMQIYRKRIQYDPHYAALAWIYVITKSELKDYKLRELKNFAEFNESVSQNLGHIPNREYNGFEDNQEVQYYISGLDEKEKQILQDRYLNELEYEEIAQKLNESESNIRQIVSRSLKFLRKKHATK